ncbi:MAG: hypothetical protein FWB73_03150 [Treponema sp.]|nr:hypothetical protein [Treponema sp.]
MTLILVLILSCGIEKFYYLPQIPQTNINTAGGSNVSLDIPSLSQFSTLGAYYSIFYKIYISNHFTGSPLTSDYLIIHSTLNNDYNALYSYTNPANNTSITIASTFRNRQYHELKFEAGSDFNNENINNIITSSGGSYKISFPTAASERPYITDATDSFKYNLFRAGESDENNGIKFDQEPDRYFFYSPELIERTDHTNFINNDVTLYSGSEPLIIGYAYVSMYIVAVGQNPEDFRRVFGKPTHIGVFNLPNAY